MSVCNIIWTLSVVCVEVELYQLVQTCLSCVFSIKTIDLKGLDSDFFEELLFLEFSK